jgi:AcrR family transcriptional regulator
MARTIAEDHFDKRRAIMDRAAELFATHGYDRASMAMIAKASGVSKALFYHYWTDKADLLFDVLAGHLNHLVDLARGAATLKRTPRERLETLAALLLDAYRSADAVHSVQLNCMKLLPPERQEALKALERTLVEEAADMVAALDPRAARDRRVLIPLTMSFFAMLNWHHLWHREGRGLTRQDYARMVAALMADGIDGAVEAVAPARHEA